jgi:hypothetical protein
MPERRFIGTGKEALQSRTAVHPNVQSDLFHASLLAQVTALS